MDKIQYMKEISDEVLSLRKSPLYKYRLRNNYFPVIGEGSLDASIMFIGEAPGETEAKTAKPFCGRSGKVLDELLQSIKLDRNSVYITNLVKDRPQNNRDPKPKEISLYAPFLDRQIDTIRPKVIATLGRHSMKHIFEKFGLASSLNIISRIHGNSHKVLASYGDVVIVALYHPAVALYNGSMRSILMSDFKAIKKFI